MGRYRYALVVAATIHACAPAASEPEPEPEPEPEICGDRTHRFIGDDDCTTIGPAGCPAGFERSDWGCDAVAVDAVDCTAGRAVIGTTDCVPVGFVTCPSGFELVEDACRAVLSNTVCSSGRDTIGRRDCAPIGDCGARFPPADADVFVDSTFAVGQLDASHYRTIAEALIGAADDAHIAVMPGEYTAPLVITKPVRVTGHCPDRVVLNGGGVEDSGIRITGVRAEINGIAVRGYQVGVVAEQGATLEITDVLIEENNTVGLVVEEPTTSAVVDRVMVRGVEHRADGAFGFGIVIQKGAMATLREVGVSKSRTGGIHVRDADTRLVADGLVVRSIRANDSGTWGEGLSIVGGAQARLERVAIREVRRYGLRVIDPGSFATVTGLYVTDVAPDEDFAAAIRLHLGGRLELTDATLYGGVDSALPSHAVDVDGEDTSLVAERVSVFDAGYDRGAAVDVRSSAQARLTDLRIERGPKYGLLARDPRTRLEVERAVLRGGVGWLSPGIYVDAGATARLVETHISDRGGLGIELYDPETELEFERGIVEGTRPSGATTVSAGVAVLNGATLKMTSSLFRDNVDFGVILDGPGATASIVSSTVRDTDSMVDPSSGFGVLVRNHAGLSMSESTVVGNRNVGIVLTRNTTATVAASAVADNVPKVGGLYGFGVLSASKLRINNTAIVRSEAAGLLMTGKGSIGFADRVWIAEGQKRSVDEGYGHGIHVDGGRLSLRRSHVAGNEAVGIVVDAGGLSMSATSVAGNAVGIHVQRGSTIVEYDQLPSDIFATEASIARDCVFTDNVTKVGAGNIPLPTIDL